MGCENGLRYESRQGPVDKGGFYMKVLIRGAAGMGLLFFLTAGCVTERMESPDDGKTYLRKELDKIVKRLPFQNGTALYQDLNRLVAFGEFAVEPMRACLDDDNAKVRAAGAYVLGQLKVTDAVEDLVALTRDENKQVRLEAARAVLEIGAWDTVPVLLEGLEDESPSVRYLCFEVLHRKTGEDFGYRFNAPEPERTGALERWREWWRRMEQNPSSAANLASR